MRCAVLLMLLFAAPAFAQAADGGTVDRANPNLPAETDLSDPPPRSIRKDWNEYDFKFFTFRWGIYTLLDWGTAAQSTQATRQIDVKSDFKVRDFRFTLGGALATKRKITYTMGLMYDGPTGSWFPRETGVQVAIPELYGNVFVGRQKEGLSLNKITVGYAVWTMERMPISEASIPVMSDGIKWLGGLPNKRANWNFGYFHNVLKKNPGTGFYDDAFAARFAWLPMLPDHEGALLHLAIGYHFGIFSDGQTKLKSRPESSTAPYFLDTGVFPAKQNHLIVLEAYFRKRSWLYGAEYFFDQIKSPEMKDPFFHGGEAFVSWLITGEERGYKDLGGKLDFVFPERSAFDGGPGAWEAVLHASWSDFDSGPVQGGKFFRLTPQINWYIDDMVSIRLNYGLGLLDRFGATAVTHFFQARLQLQLD
ncbi:MAG: porin [Myxococcaceae bacterium]